MTTTRRPQLGPELTAVARLLDEGRLDEAGARCRAHLARHKRDTAAFHLMGLIETMSGRYADAIRHFEQGLRIDGGAAHIRSSLGRTHMLAGAYDAAIRAYAKVLSSAPLDPVALAGRAEVLERRGDFEAALATLEPLAGTECDGHTLIVLATVLIRLGRVQDAADRLDRHLADRKDSPITRRRLYFLHGQALDRLGDADRAFAAFTKANGLQPGAYSIEAVERRFDRLRAVFAPERMDSYVRSSNLSEQPVFIVSMPRSGSTLVEQILAAHPDVVALGEIDEMPQRVAELPRELRTKDVYPEAVERLDRAAADRLAARYLGRVDKAARDAGRFTDKHLQNYRFLGLIALLLPKARVIHCRREPRDVALSCFMQPLSPVALPYATDLRHLGEQYGAYERLMTHWRQVLELPMLDVVYEDLVREPEPVIREIVTFVGLPWNDACLSPQDSERDVATASYDQVRRPITTDAVARWERYARYLTRFEEAAGP